MCEFWKSLRNDDRFANLVDAMLKFSISFLLVGFFFYCLTYIDSVVGSSLLHENIDVACYGCCAVIFLEIFIFAVFKFWKLCKAAFLFFFRSK